MKLDQKELTGIGALLKKANRILLISHKSPDGDTLGSSLGLLSAFTEMGKEVDVFCLDPAPPVMRFMPNVERIRQTLPEKLNYDAVFIVDCGATHLTGLNESHPKLFDKSMEVVNIDHHVSNNLFGKYNLVVTTAASATAVVYEMLVALDAPISRHTATCLLTGIYTDTGSFMHSNTNAETMRIAARLLAKGANLRDISKDIFNTLPISTMRLWGKVLRNTYQTPDNVTMSIVTRRDFSEAGASYDEMTGVVDYVNSIPGANYSVILTERDGVVKGSLRTLKEEVDVAKIAGRYGGGGHIKAAGFTVKGQLEKEVRWRVVDR